MRSELDVRLGVQVPQIAHLPPDVHSLAAAEEAIELADAYGLCDGHPLDESQKFTLRAALGERADGSWAATQVGDFKGRQGGGKSDSVAARELAGLILFDEPLIIHTAHEFPTANESFLRLVAVFENWDDLRRRVRRVLYGNGTQSINLLSGQRILYKARTAGAGRGFTKAALVVYDEAQHLQGEHLAASGPARLAYPNSQSWYAGSGGLTTSTTAWRLRRRALTGAAGRLAYLEGTAEDVTITDDGRIASVKPDPSDRNGWAKANPGLGRWVSEESLESLFDELGPELFMRECMCVWDPEPDADRHRVIPQHDWDLCEDPQSSPLDPLAFAVDVAPERGSSSIGVAGLRPDGRVHLEVVENRPGVSWVVDRLAAILRKAGVDTVTLCPGAPAGGLMNDLGLAGIKVNPCGAQESVQACGALFDGIMDRRYLHIGQPVLSFAVDGAEKRSTGDAWVWDRRNSASDITPLVAVTLAAWALHSYAPNADPVSNIW